jgi:rhodanese-related sulfurtransferase
MSRRISALLIGITLLILFSACGGADSESQATSEALAAAVSGRIEAGLRVLTVDPTTSQDVNYTVYRGDYLRLDTPTGEAVTITVPELKIQKTFPVAEGEKTYFKMSAAGSFAYTAGAVSGTIEAVEYSASGYQEVSALEGAALIKNINPLVLDVRTPGEYAGGHLENSLLVPVQVLQAEIGQLGTDKDKPIFVYCRSGNRSTVASKVLLDHGFTNVVNLRHGIGEWQAKNLPIVK